ncbi:MAG: mandelate racemase/muconate lactonizing enzyme family protein [Nitrososphaerota archaeon]|nr:mandelate racemase/muconate lactonizing enzyme family protein [Candidatus Bathyarchaeota archaeon]MCX8162015.1 mandelate racemase/muconate lactonizing enzyme family protein [Candidatus Bathyarchaeota archaeon]MDW8061934.1 mandelate racemase/muconate lactonizing enzyme family protein [Nitrososphaerota archaeon]
MMDSDVRIDKFELSYKSYRLRIPLKFGSVVVEESISLIVKALARNRSGREAVGLGSMPLVCEWAFPNPRVEYEDKLEAMKIVAERYAKLIEDESRSGVYRHPIDWFIQLEKDIARITDSVSRDLNLKVQLPILAALVAVSPIDAAIHDGFGKVNGICSYDGYSPRFMERDLSFYLGSRFKGKWLSDYVKPRYEDKIPVFHLVGGLDKLTRDEAGFDDPKDGFPVSLEEWIERDGVFCFKVKLTGTDIDWDVRRTIAVAEVASEALRARGVDEYYLSVDSNEMHRSPGNVLEYLRRVKSEAPNIFDRILYVEQPVSRDIASHRFDMKPVSQVKPVLVDEGATNLESFDLALSLGWSGVALKTCKCHSSALLMVAKSEELGVPYSVQDLTCPGLALVHSAGFAARINPIKGFEYNARQYLPLAFPEVQERYPEIFKVRNGYIETRRLNNTLGLGLYV